MTCMFFKWNLSFTDDKAFGETKCQLQLAFHFPKHPTFFFFIFSMIPNEYHMKFCLKFSYIVKSDRRCEMILGGYHRI